MCLSIYLVGNMVRSYVWFHFKKRPRFVFHVGDGLIALVTTYTFYQWNVPIHLIFKDYILQVVCIVRVVTTGTCVVVHTKAMIRFRTMSRIVGHKVIKSFRPHRKDLFPIKGRATTFRVVVRKSVT